MKSVRFMAVVVMVSLSTWAFGQSDAKKSFDNLKTVAGTWEGKLTTDPPDPSVQGKVARVTLRVTSMGNAMVHEIRVPGRDDDPITMFYVDDGRLMLTHYCDAGNRPRMAGKMSADGKTTEFALVDVAGSLQYGHMHHSVFTMVDENHHNEDWTFMVGDKPVIAHFELARVK